MEKLAPTDTELHWDNGGFQVGSAQTLVDLALVALDCTDAVIDEAVSAGAQMIVTHHPLIFGSPLYKVTDGNLVGRKVLRLIKGGICLYCSHTALDLADGGTNDLLAEYLGLTGLEPLVGEGDEKGLGRVGFLEKTCTLAELAAFAGRRLNVAARYAGNPETLIEKVAVNAGAGSGRKYVAAALKAGAAALLTGDAKYHDTLEALEMGLCIVDATHYSTEAIMAKRLCDLLNEKAFGLEVKVLGSEKNGQVFVNMPAPEFLEEKEY
jgi:dinuclear metal center YbgI/SA1388 family protein